MYITYIDMNYNFDRTTTWVKLCDGTFNIVDIGRPVALGEDGDGDVYIHFILSGYYSGAGTFYRFSSTGTILSQGRLTDGQPGTVYSNMRVSKFGHPIINYQFINWLYRASIYNKDGSSYNQYDPYFTHLNRLCRALAVDTSENIYFIGENNSLIKIAPIGDGVLVWDKTSPIIPNTASIEDIAISPNETCIYGTGIASTDPVSGQILTGSNDIFICKWDIDGTLIWGIEQPYFNVPTSQKSPQVKIDGNNNCYVVYLFEPSEFDIPTTNGQVVYYGTAPVPVIHYICLVKVDPDGNVKWVRKNQLMNIFTNINSVHMAVDVYGNSYIGYSGSVDNDEYGSGIYLLIVNTDGTVTYNSQDQLWTSINKPDHNRVGDIYISSNGSVYIAGIGRNIPIGNEPPSEFDAAWIIKLAYNINDHPKITCDDHYIYTIFVKNNPNGTSSVNWFDLIFVKQDKVGNVLSYVNSTIFNTDHDDINPNIINDGTYSYITYQTGGTVSGGTSLYPYDIVVMKIPNADISTVTWIKQQSTFNTTRSDEYPSIDVDQYGSVYICYQTYGRVSGGYRTALPDKTDVVVFKLDGDGVLQWIKQSISFNSIRGNSTPCIKVDKLNEKLYIAHSCAGPITGQPFSGYADIVLFKMDYDGNIVTNIQGKPWILEQPTFNTTSYDSEPVLSIDEMGFIYLCYTTTGATRGCSNMGSSDIVIIKLNSNGNVIKILQNNTINTAFDDLHPSMYYKNGYIYIAYQTNDAIIGQSSTGMYDIVVIKVNTITLNPVWVRQSNDFNTSQDDITPSITVDSNGDCYVSYISYGTIDNPSNPVNGSHVLTTCISNNGKYLWTTYL